MAALGGRFDADEAAIIERMLRESGGTIPDAQVSEVGLAVAINRRGRSCISTTRQPGHCPFWNRLMYTKTVSSSSQARGFRQRTPYVWLGAGVLGLGVALAGGTGVAHADSAPAGDASPSDTSPSASSSRSMSAGVSRAARGSGAVPTRRQSATASPAASDRSVVAAASPAAVVQPQRPGLATPRPVPVAKPAIEDVQVQIAHSFHDARDWVSATLSGPVGGVANNGLFLVRRVVLPTGEHVGLHGTAECVAAENCSGKDLTHTNFRNANFSPSATAAGPLPAASRTVTANAVNNANADLSGANLIGAGVREIRENRPIEVRFGEGSRLRGPRLSGAFPDGAIGNTTGYQFRVQLGTGAISVQEVSGLDVQQQPIEVRPSNSPVFSTIKMPGIVKLGNVTLSNGVFTSGDTFSNWFNKIGNPRETLTITLIDESGQPAMIWTLTNAFPTKITGAKTEGNETAFATVEIAHEGLRITNA